MGVGWLGSGQEGERLTFSGRPRSLDSVVGNAEGFKSDLIPVSSAVLGQEFDSDVYNKGPGESLEPAGPRRRLSQHTRWAVLSAGQEWGSSKRVRVVGSNGQEHRMQVRDRTMIQEAVWRRRKSAEFPPNN